MTTWRLYLFIFYIVDKVRFQAAGGSTVQSDFLMCVHIVVKTLKIGNVMLKFSRSRQRNVLKSAPPVQHDYFSSFNQSYHFPGPFFLLKFLVMTIVKTRKEWAHTCHGLENSSCFSLQKKKKTWWSTNVLVYASLFRLGLISTLLPPYLVRAISLKKWNQCTCYEILNCSDQRLAVSRRHQVGFHLRKTIFWQLIMEIPTMRHGLALIRVWVDLKHKFILFWLRNNSNTGALASEMFAI